MPVFGLSTPVQTALIGLAGLVVTSLTGVLIALLNRSVKAEAHEASTGVDTLADVLGGAMERLGKVEEREQNCLEALEWAHGRIVLLESNAGLPSSPPPTALRRSIEDRKKPPVKKASPKRRGRS